jgi:hypothetical protein
MSRNSNAAPELIARTPDTSAQLAKTTMYFSLHELDEPEVSAWLVLSARSGVSVVALGVALKRALLQTEELDINGEPVLQACCQCHPVDPPVHVRSRP